MTEYNSLLYAGKRKNRPRGVYYNCNEYDCETLTVMYTESLTGPDSARCDPDERGHTSPHA